VGNIDLRRGLRSGAEYITVAVTTKLAPNKKEMEGWKSNKKAEITHDIMIENDVAKTFSTLSAYCVSVKNMAYFELDTVFLSTSKSIKLKYQETRKQNHVPSQRLQRLIHQQLGQ
jgi:hypothetical protein